MIKSIQRYFIFIKAAFIEQFQYRLNFLFSLGMASMVVVLNYFLWKAVFTGQSMIGGITSQQMMSYVIISGTIRGAIFFNVILVYGELVEKGDIVLTMQRPVSLPLMFLAQGFGTMLVYIITRALPIFITGAIVTSMIWPKELGTWIFFIISLSLSFTIYYLIGFAFAQVLNYLETYWSLHCAWNFIIALFTGQMIPFSFFPKELKNILFCLPFQSIFYTPISIFMEGSLESSPLHNLIVSWGFHYQGAYLLEQLLWMALLIPLVGFIWAGTRKHILIQGA